MKANFNKPLINKKIELNQVTTKKGRYYEYNGEKYYSVTTVLSKTTDKTSLEEWKNRIGHDEAKKITEEASINGTKLHNNLNSWLLNEDINVDDYFQEKMYPIQRYLIDNIRILLGTEVSLISKSYKLAGTFDLLYVNNDKKIVLSDFKTSKRKKKREWLTNYHDQLLLYKLMVEENYSNIKIDKLELLFSYQDFEFENIILETEDSFHKKVIDRVNYFFNNNFSI